MSSGVRQRLGTLLPIVLLRDDEFWNQSRGRRLGRAMVLLGYLYLGILVLLLALENYFLFPRATEAQQWFAPPARLAMRDVELTTTEGLRLHGWWTAPTGWKPTDGAILFSHGNGGNLSFRYPNMEAWRKYLGMAVFIYDYPGYGKSQGKPTEAGCYTAGETAYRWLVDVEKVPPERIIHVGESLGGAIVLELATRHPCRMAVLVSTFTSFPDMAQKAFPWLPARWLVRNRLDNLSKIGRVDCPVFIVHGKADTLIPFSMGERLHAAAKEPKRFFPIEDLPHMHPEGAEFFEAVKGFLKETE